MTRLVRIDLDGTDVWNLTRYVDRVAESSAKLHVENSWPEAVSAAINDFRMMTVELAVGPEAA